MVLSLDMDKEPSGIELVCVCEGGEGRLECGFILLYILYSIFYILNYILYSKFYILSFMFYILGYSTFNSSTFELRNQSFPVPTGTGTGISGHNAVQYKNIGPY